VFEAGVKREAHQGEKDQQGRAIIRAPVWIRDFPARMCK
jgi:hypothetical protein